MKPMIGLTMNEEWKDHKTLQNLNENYIKAITQAGGVPLLLPIVDDEEIIIRQLDNLDALVVTGGIDVNPLFYHEVPHALLKETSYRRDNYEMCLIKHAIEKQVPLLGICRGMQSINVACGGTLYQDNTLKSPDVFEHTQHEQRSYPSHVISTMSETFMEEIFGEQAFVNSFHHQSIHALAEGFSVCARSEDDLIEAIEDQTRQIWCVQFHPEGMLRDQKMRSLFHWFIEKIES